jgi:hypothetical protein
MELHVDVTIIFERFLFTGEIDDCLGVIRVAH